MSQTYKDPKYSCIIKTKKTKYDVSGLMTNLVISQNKDDLAKGVSLTIPNLKDTYKHLYNNINVRDSLVLYCDTGSGRKEIFRGIIWEKNYNSDVEKDLTLTAYDRLIYLQNTKDNFFFAKGRTTESIVKSICKKWNVKLDYDYEGTKHKRKVYRGEKVSDVLTKILKEAKKKTGTKYIVFCKKGIVYIRERGYNKKIYELNHKENALSQNTKVTMDGMVTKVSIYKEQEITGKKDKAPKKLTSMKENTEKYGTLQEIIIRDQDDKNSKKAKKEAKELLKKHSKPEYTRTVKAVDNPYIEKGHKIKSNAGALNGYYYVKGVEHDCANGIMTLEVEK